MEIKAFAKINLYLDCIGRRADGYHELVTVMQRIGLYDEIEIEKADSITVTCEGGDVPSGRDNIAYRCAELFFESMHIDGGAKIHIKKDIPSQAGLGGGSADGAAVLEALDTLYGTDAGKQRLAKTGAAAGADIPFCIYGGRALCTGIGDRITPLPSKTLFLCIAKGAAGVSTKEAYAAIDRLPSGDHMAAEEIKNLYMRGNLCLYNIFEESCAPTEDSRIIKDVFRRYGASSLMTGSGAAFFGIFDDMRTAERAADELSSKGFFARAVTSV